MKTVNKAALILLSLISAASQAALTEDPTAGPTVSVCWERPNQRIDGTPFTLAETARYEIEHSANGATANYEVPGEAEHFEKSLRTFGENCFRVRVFDTAGLSSAWTQTLCITGIAPPTAIKFKQC